MEEAFMRRGSVRVLAVALFCFIVGGILPRHSFGLVIASNSSTSEGSVYRNVPIDDPGWDNIGQMSNGTGIYFGDGWVLAPYHVYQSNHKPGANGFAYIELDRQYDEILGTAQRIEFDDSTDADLIMFRVNGNPDIDLIEIRETDLPGPQLATIISAGRIREGDLQSWDIDGTMYSGFATSDIRLKQWGRNWITDFNDSVITVGGAGNFGETEALWSRFDEGKAEEVQPVDKDSGGGAFVQDGDGDWQLTGTILLVAPNYPTNGQIGPGTHAIYNSGAYYSDLTAYYDQIAAIRNIPLPGDADRNGTVDIYDFALLRSTFGMSGAPFPADFNNDLVVDDGDLLILETNFGMVSGSGVDIPGGPFAPVPVPEPATIFVLIGAAPLFLRSRRRRGRA
jgi:hypothetical protein